MKNDLKVDILKALKLTKENGPADTDYGICFSVENYMMSNLADATSLVLRELFRKWPGFSGSLEYPVTHPSVSPSRAYLLERDLWIGEYGARRMDLLNFLIETLEGELV